MKPVKTFSVVFVMIVIAATLGCSNTSKAPDVAGNIRHALDQSGLNDVSVSQDRDKGVVTLSGKVGSDDDKGRAESIAKSIAGTEVVSNEIGVRPTAMRAPRRKLIPISTRASTKIWTPCWCSTA